MARSALQTTPPVQPHAEMPTAVASNEQPSNKKAKITQQASGKNDVGDVATAAQPKGSVFFIPRHSARTTAADASVNEPGLPTNASLFTDREHDPANINDDFVLDPPCVDEELFEIFDDRTLTRRLFLIVFLTGDYFR